MIEYDTHDATESEEPGYVRCHTILIGPFSKGYGLENVETNEILQTNDKMCAENYFNFEFIPPNMDCEVSSLTKKATRIA